jgi:sugar lactone lactonase YvrE
MQWPVTCLVDSKDSLGEGCLWDVASQSLWWLDIARPSRIHRFTPATGEHRLWHSDVLLTAMVRRARGGFILGGEDGLYSFDEVTGAISPFAFPEDTKALGNRFNDGACDPQGRLWIGTMMQNIGPHGEDLDIHADTGKLYRVGMKGKSALMEQAIGVSNGPCWSPDGKTFYFSDSRNHVTFAYDFDPVDGVIGNRRVLNDSKDYGHPDGATVDADGCLWSARWDAACVLRIDPRGRIDRIIPIPATRPTCVCFGGPKLDVMHVTSSSAHQSAEILKRYPLQGGIFCFAPGVSGFEKSHFAG